MFRGNGVSLGQALRSPSKAVRIAVFCRLRGEDCFTRDPMSPCSQVADQAARRVRSKPPS